MKILFILLPSFVFSWWSSGHMLIAAIAENQLENSSPFAYIHFKSLLLSINSLVDNRSRSFIESACWADDIKSNQFNLKLWNSWHFIDKTFSKEIFPQIKMSDAYVNGVQTVLQAIKVLSFNINNKSAEKALFARYLVHVVGDLHQPLHCVSFYNRTYQDGDLGGNKMRIYLESGKKMNLHSFWDSGGMRIENSTMLFKRPVDQGNMTTIKNLAKRYVEEFSQQIQGLSEQLDPRVWAQESYEIAKNIAYPYFENTNIVNHKYGELVGNVTKMRISLAGIRLANLIKSIFNEGIILHKENKKQLEKTKKGRGTIWQFDEQMKKLSYNNYVES